MSQSHYLLLIVLFGVSADLLHGFERFNLQNLVSFPGPWRVECPHTSMPGGSTL
jgi:hypothetical protein